MQNNGFSTLFVGRQLIHLPTVDSTNLFAQELLANTAPIHEGTIIWADHQDAGRGQQGSVWKTEPGENLTASFILLPVFLRAADQFLLNKVVCIAACKALSTYGISAKIKWPNDVYVGDKKIAGILIENQLQGNFLKNSIIGIGLNVNQQSFDPALPNPTSVFLETGQKLEIPDLLTVLAKELEVGYLQLKAGKTQALDAAYEQLLYAFQEPFLFEDATGTFEGKISGVSAIGQLQIATTTKLRSFSLKEVRFISRLSS